MKIYKIANHCWKYAVVSFCILSVSCRTTDYLKTGVWFDCKISELTKERIRQSLSE